MIRCIAVLGIATIASAAALAQPQLTWVGSLAGGNGSHLSAVSADGLYLVGWSTSSSGVRAFRRTHYQGLVSLGSMPGGGETFATGVDNFGVHVVGWGIQGDSPTPFIWSQTAGLAALLLPSGDTWGRAYDISANGQWIVGQTGNASRSYATRWSNGVPSHLSEPAQTSGCCATAVTDAGVAVGYADLNNGNVVPLRWDGDALTQLPFAGADTRAQALAISETNTAFGGSMNETTADTAYKWTGSQAPVPIALPSSSSAVAGIATATSAGGQLYGARDYLQAPEVFLVGPAVGGTKTVSLYLTQSGVSATGFLVDVTGINAAGNVVVGNGIYFDRPDGWLLRLPGAPSVCAADVGVQGGLVGTDGILDNNDFIAFISLFFLSDPRADMGSQGATRGSDGRYDNNDFIVFIDHFFGGCP